MTDVASADLVSGGRVVLEEISSDHVNNLQARVYASNGALLNTVLVQQGFYSDGSQSPPGTQSYFNEHLIALTGGGFAVAYDRQVVLSGVFRDFLEVRAFDATGGLTGQTGGEAWPFAAADPSLTPLADGGFALVANDLASGQRETADLSFYTSDVIRTGLVTLPRPFGSAIYPPPIYDSSRGVVVTFGSQGSPLREVLDVHGNALTPQLPVQTFTGGVGGDALPNTSGPDNLVGGDENDTLFGGAGYDVLVGGAGADTFDFSADGSVDQARDFVSGLDHLQVVDAAGAPVSGADSVLQFDARTEVLSWQAGGSGAPAPVGVLSGVEAISASDFATGFQPLILRLIHGDGSSREILFGRPGVDPYTQTDSDFDPSGNLVKVTTDLAAGGQIVDWFDAAGAAWRRLDAHIDSSGALVRYDTYWDDGSQVLWQFDPHQAAAWQRTVTEVDSQGRVASHTVVDDDGAYTTVWFDNLANQPWNTRAAEFDATGALTSYTVYYDLGDHVLWFLDPHDHEPWAWRQDSYDAAGRLLSATTAYDDGVSKVATFDALNLQPWSMIVDVFDASGRQTGHWIYGDDGSFTAT